MHQSSCLSGHDRGAGRVVRRLGVLLLLLGLLLAPAAGGAAAARNVSASPAPGAGEQTFYVDWNITASGQSFDGDKTTIQRIAISGSAVILKKPGELLRTFPFRLTVTDDTYSIAKGFCYQVEDWRSVIDPARYMGGPDKFWVQPESLEPRQRADGSWYMLDPFEVAFWSDGLNVRNFAYKFDSKHQDCVYGTFVDTQTGDGALYSLILGWNPKPFEGNATGTTFTRREQFTVQEQTLMTVNFNATIRLACGVDNPNIRLDVDQDTIPPNKGDTLNPPDPANLTVKVSCDGVPVKNAQVKIQVDAKNNSGGHLHASGNVPRPRGYLKGPGAANYTELTEQKKSITVQTDSMGMAKVAFRPGTDNATGGGSACAGKQRGIAGIYEVTASLVNARFRDRQAQRAIQVKRTDFVPLPLPGNHYLRTYSSSIHPEGTWGTQPTMGGIQALANRFYDYQIQHNQVLTQTGKTAWPIVNLGIIDISLQDGGLFDSGGTNVCAGGTQVNFIPWQIPHQTHLKGTGVDISTNAVTWPGSQAKNDWWKSALRGLGCSYGRWAPERTLHLDVDQNAGSWGQMHPGCQFPLPPVAALQSSSPIVQADAPILFVSMADSTLDEDSDGLPIAAPGQVLTFTIGANNLSGTSAAHQVVLTATLPNGLQFVNADPPASRRGDANQPVWDIGILTTRASLQTFRLAARVNGSVTPGTVLTMMAQATASDAGPTPDDHFAEALLVKPLGPDLAVQAQDLVGAAMTIGQPITTTFGVVNRGTAIAPSTRLTLTLPASVTLVSAIPAPTSTGLGTANWNLGGLAPDASRRITVTLDLDPSLAARVPADSNLETGGVLTYTLRAGSATPDIDLSNNMVQVVKGIEFAGPDLAVWLGVQGAGDLGTLTAGQDVTYTLMYGNFGNRSAPGTAVTLSLGSGVSLTGAEPAASRTAPSPTFAGGVVGWDLGNLAVGDANVIQVHIRVNAVPPEGSMALATITSNELDINPGNNVDFVVRRQASGPRTSTYLPLVRR